VNYKASLLQLHTDDGFQGAVSHQIHGRQMPEYPAGAGGYAQARSVMSIVTRDSVVGILRALRLPAQYANMVAAVSPFGMWPTAAVQPITTS